MRGCVSAFWRPPASARSWPKPLRSRAGPSIATRSPALLYGDPEQALISIICGRHEETLEDETWISIEVEPGVKPAPPSVVLVLENGKARKEVPLEAHTCAPDQCITRAEGEVYRYEATFPGVEPALDIAENVTKLSIDAPGAKLSAAADKKAFSKFAGLCRNW